jgi:hypothetical protein
MLNWIKRDTFALRDLIFLRLHDSFFYYSSPIPVAGFFHELIRAHPKRENMSGLSEDKLALSNSFQFAARP